MKTGTIRTLASLALLSALAGLIACGGGKTQLQTEEVNPEFARFISGYTSGRVSARAAIRVELADALKPDEFERVSDAPEVRDNLFSLSPPVKGAVTWVNGRVAEFRPDGPLNENTPYKVSFALGKVLPDVEKPFRVFTFDIRTIEQDFVIKEAFYQPIDEKQNRWNAMTVEVDAADALTDAEAHSVFSAKIDGKALPVKLAGASSGGQRFRFTVDSIERTASDRTLKLVCDGKAVGGKKVAGKDVVIHALNAEVFKVASVQACALPERCIRIAFTDPLGKQEIKGLVQLDNVSRYTIRTDRNVVTVYPEDRFPETVKGRIDRNIKSFAGKRMADDHAFSVAVPQDRPIVKILNSGTILPDSRNLLLSFSAVNLSAVEMRVIKIYEHNVLHFLQTNPLGGAYGMTRSGRLIAKKLLRLDQDKSKNPMDWNTYAVDMSELVKKEPGAVYRVELIVRQEFSLYPCGGDLPAAVDQSKFDESNFVLTEDDMAAWNSGSEYYSSIDYNYEMWDWYRRHDPCHATYYMDSDNDIVTSASLYASNIGIIAKKGQSKEMFIAAQDIRTTEPISGGRVRVLNYQLAPIVTGVTDANGFYSFNAGRGEAFIVEVAHGGQKGYLKVGDGSGDEMSVSRFDVGGKAIQRGLKGFTYGERGVWRPGDDIYLTFILEDREKTIPANHPVTMDIYNPQGQFFRKLAQTNPVGNFYSFAFKTEEQSPTGMWRAVVSVGGTKFEHRFRVETIKPNRLKINVDFGTDIIDKRDLEVSVGAAWLHGAAARDLRTKILLKLSPSSTWFKGFENYNFTNPAADKYSHEKELSSGRLDETGKAEFSVEMPKAQEAAGMLNAAFITTVEESGGGESMTIHSLPYSPFPAYVGLNTHLAKERDILATDTTHYFDVALLDAKGKPVPSGELVYKVYRLQWSWWWDESSSSDDKLSSVVTGSSVSPVIDRKVTVKNGRARVDFRRSSEDWGRYLVYIKDPDGGHASGAQLFVDDTRWGGRSRQSDPQGLTMLTFETDKQSYTVGEDVRITLGKGGKGRALMSLENGTRTLRQWWEETKEGEPTSIRFRVTEDLAPNCYVHITLLQHHDQTLNDMPIRMYGVMPITVVHPLGELKPVIGMPDVLRTEKEFTVTVGESNRQDMVYTLAIVDEGLLDINNFKTPNPYAEFNVKEALGVKTYDLYNQVVGAFAAELRPLFSVGGGEDLNRGADRNQRFKPVVMHLGPFRLKAGETNSHSVTLPPYIGSVRVMVVAANDKYAYGRAEKAVPVRNPLMVLTTLPRVLGPGEDVLMPVNLFVTEKSIRDVKVNVKVTDPLELSESASKDAAFGEAGDRIVNFKLKVKKRTGKAKVTVTATSGKEVSTETVDIEVRNPNPPLTRYKSYVVKPGESADVDYNFDEELPGSAVALEYARIPSVNLSGSLQYLIGYPHGCAEQSTSKAFPQLFLHHFTSLNAAEKREIQDNVEAVIRKLQTMQTSEGGISMWSGGSQADDWVTSYVAHFLAAAKDQGHNVPQQFLNDLKKYQARRAGRWGSGNYNDDMIQAYRLYSLAMLGESDLGSMNKMRERSTLSPLARWQLASAYAVSGRKDAARLLVSNQKTWAENYSAFNRHYGSKARDEAVMMETFILLGDMDQALTLARSISGYLNGGSYTTQATAWSLYSMARFAGTSGKGEMAFTTSYLGKTNNIKTPKPVYKENLAPVNKSGSVRVTNTGSGNVYLGRTMTCTPMEDKSPAVSNRLSVQESYADLDGKPLRPAKLAQGTDFVINVRVQNTGSMAYTNIALTHIIPSGWEIFNTRLADPAGGGEDGDDDDGDGGGKKKSSKKPSDGITYQDIRDDRVLTYLDLQPGASKTVSIRAQAAYAGKFFMPAIACQTMYDNTIYARTTGTWVEVVTE